MKLELNLNDFNYVAEIKHIDYDQDGDIVDNQATIKIKLDEIMEAKEQEERDMKEFTTSLKVKGDIITEYEGIPYRIGVNDNLQSFEVDTEGYIYLDIFYLEFA